MQHSPSTRTCMGTCVFARRIVRGSVKGFILNRPLESSQLARHRTQARVVCLGVLDFMGGLARGRVGPDHGVQKDEVEVSR